MPSLSSAGRKVGRWASGFRWLTYGAAVAIGLGAGGLVGRLSEPSAPIDLLEVREVDGVAVVGRRLDLYFRLVKRTECQAHVTRWLWHWRDVDGKAVPRRVPLLEGSNPPVRLRAEDAYILSLPLPADIEPGDWFYQSQTYDGCAWGSRLLAGEPRTSPSVPVRIEAPSPDAPPRVVAAPGPVMVVPVGGGR